MPGGTTGFILARIGAKKLLKLQNAFDDLYQYSESKKAHNGTGTAKPLPGVDGQAVVSAIGRLSLLKTGFGKRAFRKA